jgi:hypothetical protein
MYTSMSLNTFKKTECEKAFSCLTGEVKNSCGIESAIRKGTLVVRPKEKARCPHSFSSYSDYICTCPVKYYFFATGIKRCRA